MDAKTSELIDTGKKCPECGRPLVRGIIRLFGKTTEYNITCQCVIDKRKDEDERLREFKRIQHIERLIASSGIPKKWVGATFYTLIKRPGMEKALTSCINYASEFASVQSRGIGMYLYGPTGSGKTHLAAAIANTLLKKGVSVKWWNVTSLYNAIKETFGTPDTGIMSGCKSAGLLILDDLGTEKTTGWTAETAYDIINSRIDNLLPTIITSNLTLSDLSRLADSRLVSRLSDKDVFPHIANTASDYRREKR